MEFSKTETSYWSHIVALFDLIDGGQASYGVPAYNGGLFNADAHPFLHDHADHHPLLSKRIPDYFLARVIEALGRALDPLRANEADNVDVYAGPAMQRIFDRFPRRLRRKKAHVE